MSVTELLHYRESVLRDTELISRDVDVFTADDATVANEVERLETIVININKENLILREDVRSLEEKLHTLVKSN